MQIIGFTVIIHIRIPSVLHSECAFSSISFDQILSSFTRAYTFHSNPWKCSDSILKMNLMRRLQRCYLFHASSSGVQNTWLTFDFRSNSQYTQQPNENTSRRFQVSKYFQQTESQLIFASVAFLRKTPSKFVSRLFACELRRMHIIASCLNKFPNVFHIHWLRILFQNEWDNLCTK